MSAFNWITLEASCPVCATSSRIRCQTHVASAYSGDSEGRFHDREYELGQPMAWWPREDKRFDSWRADRRRTQETASNFDEEACYANCSTCNAALFVVIRFHENVPERMLAIGREAEWPVEYLR
jgi:hypothetical protein